MELRVFDTQKELQQKHAERLNATLDTALLLRWLLKLDRPVLQALDLS